MEELYRVTWYCKHTKKVKMFLFDSYIDDRQMNRVIFTDSEFDKVLTLNNDSFTWMITRPNKNDINEN